MAMSSDDNVLYQSTLYLSKKPHQVILTKSFLSWEAASNGGPTESPSSEPFIGNKRCKLVPLQELIAVCPERSLAQAEASSSKPKKQQKSNSPLYIELQPVHPVSFSIYVLKRVDYKWKKKKITFFCSEPNLCKIWVEKIQDALCDPRFCRPQRLLVFVNPYGGKRKAPNVYKEHAAPLFELANVTTHVITTQHANHAKEIIMGYNLSRIDGVVCVGGDGMFTELLNGLIDRKMKDAGKTQTKSETPVSPDIRVGIIPAGSTDTIVYTSTGINDPVTSTLHIILGDSIGLDVCSIHSGDQFLRYSVSLLSYGYYGDMLKDSESNRWMGPARYQLAGAKKFLGHKAYEGEVAFKLCPNTDSNPKDKVFCIAGCNVCGMSNNKKESRYYAQTNEEDFSSDSDELQSSQSWQTVQTADGWHRLRGKYLAVASFTMSCRCALAPLGGSPFCHLGDGTSDLVLIHDCSRTQFLRHLYRCSTKNANQFDFPFVKVFRVKEWSFTVPSDKGEGEDQSGSTPTRSQQRSKHSVWNCDGEVVTQQNLTVKVHCQLVKLFARGIEEPETLTEPCTSCCSSCD